MNSTQCILVIIIIIIIMHRYQMKMMKMMKMVIIVIVIIIIVIIIIVNCIIHMYVNNSIYIICQVCTHTCVSILLSS